MLFLDAGVLSGAEAVWYSAGLLAFNMGFMGGLFYAALDGIRKLKKLYKDLKELNVQLVKDKNEDKEKFAKVSGEE